MRNCLRSEAAEGIGKEPGERTETSAGVCEGRQRSNIQEQCESVRARFRDWKNSELRVRTLDPKRGS